MSRPVRYARLPTEQPHPRSRSLDRLSVSQILRLMNREDATVPRAVARVMPSIAEAVALIVERLRHGGRLFFVGAGTSGRLGVLEAAECPPTFHTPPSLVQAIIAGGRGAVFRSREGAEDNRRAARQAIRRRVRRGDVVVGIAASGVTPFVDAALVAARAQRATTMLLTCHPRAHARSHVDLLIAPCVGPEVIAGSTRLKAGTATKLILNMLTVSTMVRLGKIYGPWMVDVRPTSRKLHARARRIVQELAQVLPRKAVTLLRRSRGQVKPAIVMGLLKTDYRRAQRLLAHHEGRLRPILESQNSKVKRQKRTDVSKDFPFEF